MIRGNQQVQTVQVGNADRSGAVLLLGAGLILANFLFANENQPMLSYLTGKSKSPPTGNLLQALGPTAFLLLALFLLLLLAKTGEVGGNLAVLFLVAAWVVFLLNKPSAVATVLGQASSSSKTSGAQ